MTSVKYIGMDVHTESTSIAVASAIAATYAGEFLGTVASFRAARIDAQTAITADFRPSSTK
jgi:hypothetical protein